MLCYIFYYTNKYYVIKPFCVRSNITSSIDLFNSGTTNSGFIRYGPVDPKGLNPVIIFCAASSTYLRIKKWSKLNTVEDAETGKFV